jgi:hypothetical protein
MVADAVRLQQVEGDHSQDDDFHLQADSPGIDRGDPLSYSLAEPWPSGTRADAGAYGNTAEATASPSQEVQVLSPNGIEKFEVGSPVTIQWRSSGLTQNRVVALINAGGKTVTSDTQGNWLYNNYQTVSYSDGSFTNAVNVTGVSNPAPQGVYQTYAYTQSGVGNSMAWHLPVADGTYTIRLHFVDPSYNSANQRKFDIKLQGTLVETGFDPVKAAGGRNRAVVREFKGIEARESTPPRLVAIFTSFSSLMALSAAGRPPLASKLSMPPKPERSFLASPCWGWPFSPG